MNGSGIRRLADELSWQVRGAFATEQARRVGFWARGLFQPGEIRARIEAGRELAAEVSSTLRVDDRDGHRILDRGALPDVAEITAKGRAIVTTLLADRDSSSAPKSFHRNKLARGDEHRALLGLALDRRVLAMAAAYLGVLPVIGDLDYFMSIPSAPPWKKSQLWHCDDDSPRQLKLFIYCDDVDDDNGPFEMIPAEPSHAARSALGYRYAGRRYRVTDEEMDRHLSRDVQLAIRGPRDSAFVVDTARCFHKGSRITLPDRHRMVAVILYCTPTGSKLPLRLARRPGPYAELANQVTGKVERAVLGLPLT